MANKPIQVCRYCIDDDSHPTFFDDDNWEDFNAKYCVTECNNNFIPKYLPPEQVIKYLKRKHVK